MCATEGVLVPIRIEVMAILFTVTLLGGIVYLFFLRKPPPPPPRPPYRRGWVAEYDSSD